MSTTPESIELLEIVDAIADADVIEDTEKAQLLTRIGNEEGIVSADLRQDIVSVLRRQADAESVRMRDDDELLRRSRTTRTASPEDRQEADMVLSEAERGQAVVSKEIQQLVDSVREDVNRMEKSASRAAEGVRRAGDEKSIEEIRRNLSSGGTLAS